MKSIIITSAVQNVGKTTLAMLLTFCAVKRKKKVLSIDADIGRYTFTERVGAGEELKAGKMGIMQIEELGYKFDFGFCDTDEAIKIDKKYDMIIVDFDVSRSGIHGNYYLPGADLIITPQPPWTANKIKDWIIRFQKASQTKTKAYMMTYPVAFGYDDKAGSIEAIKWTYPELYDRWKENKAKKIKIVSKNGVEYSSHWDSYINFLDFDKVKLQAYINKMIIKLEGDFKKWL